MSDSVTVILSNSGGELDRAHASIDPPVDQPVLAALVALLDGADLMAGDQVSVIEADGPRPSHKEPQS